MARQVRRQHTKAMSREVATGHHPHGVIVTGTMNEDGGARISGCPTAPNADEGGLAIDTHAHFNALISAAAFQLTDRCARRNVASASEAHTAAILLGGCSAWLFVSRWVLLIRRSQRRPTPISRVFNNCPRRTQC
jgi:hypothetical protein